MFRTALLCCLLSIGAAIAAEDLLYHENLDGDLTDYQISIETKGNATEYTLVKNHEGEELSRERILVDHHGNTLEWSFKDFGQDIVIDAARTGRRISVTKTEGGKTESERYRLKNDSPWHQLFPFGMEQFVTEGEEERPFWFIQPQNLKLSSMKATRGEEKSLTINGIRQRAVEVEITIDNWLSRFWKGLYVLRSRDGRYLFYEGILRKNLSRGTVELVRENQTD